MKTSRRQLARIIADSTLRGSFGPSRTRSLAAYLLKEGRVGELDSLLRDVQSIWAEQGVVEAVVHSAHELSAEARRGVEAEVRRVYPAAKHVVVTPKLDRAVIGGLRLDLPGYRLDRTVAGELRRFTSIAVQGKDSR